MVDSCFGMFDALCTLMWLDLRVKFLMEVGEVATTVGALSCRYTKRLRACINS